MAAEPEHRGVITTEVERQVFAYLKNRLYLGYGRYQLEARVEVLRWWVPETYPEAEHVERLPPLTARISAERAMGGADPLVRLRVCCATPAVICHRCGASTACLCKS